MTTRAISLGRRSGIATLLVVSVALSGCATVPSVAARPAAVTIDFETATIADLSKMLTSKSVSAVELAAAYVERIESVNTTGPSLRAIQSVVSTWKEQAKAADKRRKAGKSLGPLDGIPVIVKDNFDIQGQITSAGSLALADNVATSDAAVVDRLQAAGAVIVAKATMVEFAFWNGASSWGYSSLGGQPLNPYDASYETSGSSAGSGIAAAAGLAAITFGSDTGGSVITPSERMSLVGYRPSTGLVSRTGIVPITTFSDTAGVMGRTVTDVALGASAIAGIDQADPATLESAPYQGQDFAAKLTDTSLVGARVGVVEPVDATQDEVALWDASVQTLREQGATVVPIAVQFTDFPFATTTYEFRENLDAYLAERTAKDFPIKSVTELADFYRANAQTTQKYGAGTLFGAEAVDLEADRANAEATLASAQSASHATMDALYSGQDLDVLMFPETSTVHLFAPIGGYPEITIPAGYRTADRHPFGVVLVADRWDDASLFSYAYDLEQGSSPRSTPSELNPTMWRCVPGGALIDNRNCLP